jgi:hypothetical protein
MSTAQHVWPAYSLLADGSTVEIRPAEPCDFDAVKTMHEAMSPDNAYLRFFILSRTAAETEARRICREPGPGRVAMPYRNPAPRPTTWLAACGWWPRCCSWPPPCCWQPGGQCGA